MNLEIVAKTLAGLMRDHEQRPLIPTAAKLLEVPEEELRAFTWLNDEVLTRKVALELEKTHPEKAARIYQKATGKVL